MQLSEPAPAKLNLALHVRRRRPDGYHDIDSIFAFTAFGDTLTGAPAGDLTLTADGEFAGALGQGDNLVLRAARALAAAAGVAAAARLHLVKRIPVAAGLGGGSADAAAALRLLNRLWGLDWSQAQLIAVARPLGADIPACVLSRPCRGRGIGDDLQPWPGAVAGVPAILVNPRLPLATAPVFAGWDGRDLGGLDAESPLSTLRNDLTASALVQVPSIGQILAALDAAGGASLVRMSGSGATCFALYPELRTRDRALEILVNDSVANGWWIVPTALTGAPPS